VFKQFHIEEIRSETTVMLILHFHYLNGKLFVSCFINAFFYNSMGTLSDFLSHLVR